MPIIESTQHKLDRVRPPRVQITYDVEIGNATEQVELPFVLGILADLSGNQADQQVKPLKDRDFVEIDRDNFNKLLRAIKPGLTLTDVQKTLPGAAEADKLTVNLTFTTLDGFHPANIIQQVPELKELYTERQRLRDLVTQLQIKDSLLEPPPSPQHDK